MNIWRKQLLVVMILLAIGLVGCGGTNSEAEESTDVAKIEEVLSEYAAAANTGDFERWIAVWAEDGLRIPPSDFGSRQVGKEQIQAAMQPLFDSSNQTTTINSEEIQILDDRAYAHGTFTITVTPKDGGDTLVLDGNFLTILAKQDDGSWKIAIDCFNF